jgi:hypothetical protein
VRLFGILGIEKNVLSTHWGIAMPRQSDAAGDVVPFVLPCSPLPPPEDLTPEQSADWVRLVGAFPAARFNAGSVPLLTELVRHQALSRQINEALDGLRQTGLTGTETRRIFNSLTRAAREETRLLISLTTKLRLAPQTAERKDHAEAAQRSTATGTPPWAQQ